MSVKLNLNLDKPAAINETQIFHSICYKGLRFRLNSGERVIPKYWDKPNQRVKTNAPLSFNINALLKKQQNEISDVTTKLIFDCKKINKETVKPLLSFAYKADVKDFSVIKVFDEFISAHKKAYAIATIKKYNTTKKHLEDFSKINNVPIQFEMFDKDFLFSFRQYFFEDIKTFQNNFAKNTAILKTFLKWAFDKGYHQNIYYQKYKVKEEQNKPVVFLILEEIERIKKLDLPEHLQKVRDIFLIECYCGLRFGDIAKLKSEHLKNDGIEISTEKTNTILRIPFNNILRNIFDKYTEAGEIKLPVISNQKTNQYLKEICKRAKINTPTIYTQFRGSRKTETTFEKWELISTHSGRHSFITNSIAIGLDSETIKKIVGHKKHETFTRYSQYNQDHTKAQMSKWDKN